MDAVGPVGLDAVEVDDLVAVEHRQVAGLTDFLGQVLQDRATAGPQHRVRHRRHRQPTQPLAAGETLAARFALQQPFLFELLADAVHGGLGQVEFLGQEGTRHRPVGLDDLFDDGKTADQRGLGATVFHAFLLPSGTGAVALPGMPLPRAAGAGCARPSTTTIQA